MRGRETPRLPGLPADPDSSGGHVRFAKAGDRGFTSGRVGLVVSWWGASNYAKA